MSLVNILGWCTFTKAPFRSHAQARRNKRTISMEIEKAFIPKAGEVCGCRGGGGGVQRLAISNHGSAATVVSRRSSGSAGIWTYTFSSHFLPHDRGV